MRELKTCSRDDIFRCLNNIKQNFRIGRPRNDNAPESEQALDPGRRTRANQLLLDAQRLLQKIRWTLALYSKVGFSSFTTCRSKSRLYRLTIC